MRRARLAALVAGVGLLVAAAPAVAVAERGTGGSRADEREALALLQAAARSGRELTYSGTQYVATWQGGAAGSSLAAVRHDPARGSTVDAEQPLAATAVLDPRMLRLLAATYDLALAGPGTCTGRDARVVEASRPDGTVAGRFWIDHDSGLLLRREVRDDTGRPLRSSEFVELAVGGGQAPVASGQPAALPARATLAGLRAEGWRVPQALPNGFRLFDTELRRDVLHLAYSDGLSTLSLFAQRGRLGTAAPAGFEQRTVGDRPVWVHDATPERVVWSDGGRVWTLVSDAPAADVRDVVAALPHDPAPGEGVRSRLARGLGRLGGMLNPFA